MYQVFNALRPKGSKVAFPLFCFGRTWRVLWMGSAYARATFRVHGYKYLNLTPSNASYFPSAVHFVPFRRSRVSWDFIEPKRLFSPHGLTRGGPWSLKSALAARTLFEHGEKCVGALALRMRETLMTRLFSRCWCGCCASRHASLTCGRCLRLCQGPHSLKSSPQRRFRRRASVDSSAAPLPNFSCLRPLHGAMSRALDRVSLATSYPRAPSAGSEREF